jgi:ribonuclease III
VISKLFKLFKKNKSNFGEIFPSVGFFSDEEIKKLEEIIGFGINNVSFFEQAFTHRSFLRDHKTKIYSNQRLEFLGDSILGMIVAEYLFHEHPMSGEGELTKIRSAYVNNTTLAKCAQGLGLENFLKIGSHAEKTKVSGLDSMLSDACEALVAAIYFDSGKEKTRDFVLGKLMPIMKSNKDLLSKNFKSILLEKFQAKGENPPTYEILSDSGPDHAKEFKVAVFLDSEIIGRGEGKSKKIAEQNAAENALNYNKK